MGRKRTRPVIPPIEFPLVAPETAIPPELTNLEQKLLGNAKRPTRAPRLIELIDKLFASWGGVDEFVRDARETYLLSPPGSAQRMKVLQLIVDLVRIKHTLGFDRDELDGLDEAQLRAIIREETLTLDGNTDAEPVAP